MHTRAVISAVGLAAVAAVATGCGGRIGGDDAEPRKDDAGKAQGRTPDPKRSARRDDPATPTQFSSPGMVPDLRFGDRAIAFGDAVASYPGGVLAQPGGKSVVFGTSSHENALDGSSMTRLGRDGKVDRSFGKDGTVVVRDTRNAGTVAYHIVLLGYWTTE